MRVLPVGLDGARIFEPKVFADERGYLFESYSAAEFSCATDMPAQFIQDLQSVSVRGVLRGIHYQVVQPQGKLVSVLVGEIFDVLVDLRRASPTFGQWRSVVLTADNHRQLWIPPGFGHGFYVLSEQARVLYKLTEGFHSQHQRTILWNDAQLGIEWPLRANEMPILSEKDRVGVPWRSAEVFE